jgi:hypothetical protein
MCHESAGKMVSQVTTRCGCTCGCPVMLLVAEELGDLEDHRKILWDQLEVIDKKIHALRSAKEP